jgi:hypothetical protein
MKAVTESAVLRACLDYLALKGVYAWRQNQGAIPLKDGGYRRFVGLKGVSDILGVLDGGRVLAVEVKKPGGKLSREQKAFLDAVRERGGLALVVRGVDELDKAMRAEGAVE